MGHPVIVPMSGGWDSTYCLLHAIRKHRLSDIQLVFFNYGQSYLKQEVRAAKYVAWFFNVPLRIEVMDNLESTRGVVRDRNLEFFKRIHDLHPEIVYFGCRNPFAWFDRYGDSNWWWGRAAGKMFGFKVVMPCVARRKGHILDTLRDAFMDVDRLYSTDPAAMRT